MRTRKLTLARAAAALAVATLGLAGNDAFAVVYWLRAAASSVNMPDPNGGPAVSVPMWGYALCTANFASCPTPVPGDWTPGPALTVPAGDTTLTVHLLNNLTVPTSLVINGLTKSMTPVWTDGSTGNRTSLSQRVRSFDAEAAARVPPATAGGTADYTWNGVKPGTYLYQSGTQPQVQVQMGLYGAMTKNAVAPTALQRQAYPATAPLTVADFLYDNQVTLLYSEIDPALHTAVGGATPTYGVPCPAANPDCGNPTSTLSYAPKYFLINGQPYPSASLVMSPVGNEGRTLVRLLNAGLTTHVPMIKGAHWTLIAEDGKPYAYRRDQYTALLPAAKTLDLLFTADSGGGDYAIVDRRMSLSNAGASDGGMLAVLRYGALGSVGNTSGGNQVPTTLPDTYNSVVGVVLNVGASEGVLANDGNTDGLPLPIKAVAASGATSGGGTYTLNSNGSFVYTPPPGTPASDTFTYRVTDGKALSDPAAVVTINLATPGAPTLTVLDNFNRNPDNSLGPNWSQTANTTTNFPDIQLAGNAATAVTTESGGLAIWNAANFGPAQGAGFTNATSLAGRAVVLKATGGTTAAPANYVRVRCEGGEVVIATMMGGSNVAVFAKQAGFAAAGCSGGGTLSAVVDAKGLVTAFLNGAYVGGVQLPDVGAWKGGGRIGIQLQSSGAKVDDFSGGTL